jgi:flavin reductase (DIM6/NTAB) family NADH-FMN oxidoreductase RutF
MLIPFAELSESEAYLAFSQIIVPRPIAWVLSDNGTGALPAQRWNLAPYSYFNAITSAPPTVMFSIGDGMAGRVKDTHRNLRERARCVIHIASSSQAQVLQDTAAELPAGVSEVTTTGLALTEWEWPVPRIADAPCALGCVATQFTRVGDTDQTVVFAQIERLWLRDDVVGHDDKGRLVVDVARYDPLARVGRGGYARLGPVFRPTIR